MLAAFETTHLAGQPRKPLLSSAVFGGGGWRKGIWRWALVISAGIGRTHHCSAPLCLLMEWPCSSAPLLRPREVCLFKSDICSEQELRSKSELLQTAELAGFFSTESRRRCWRATRCVGGHIFGPPECMPTCKSEGGGECMDSGYAYRGKEIKGCRTIRRAARRNKCLLNPWEAISIGSSFLNNPSRTVTIFKCHLIVSVFSLKDPDEFSLSLNIFFAKKPTSPS